RSPHGFFWRSHAHDPRRTAERARESQVSHRLADALRRQSRAEAAGGRSLGRNAARSRLRRRTRASIPASGNAGAERNPGGMISRRVLFALQWTLATALAVVIANLIIEILFFAVMGWALLFLLPFVGGVIGGFPVGLFQWLVLRRYVPKSEAWIVATTLGFFAAWCVAAILVAIVLTVAKEAGNAAVFLALAAATPIIGLPQRRVIKTRFWVIASTVGWSSV